MGKPAIIVLISLFFASVPVITAFATDPYTARERERLVRESQRYLNAINPEELRAATGMTRAQIMEEVRKWKNPDMPKERVKVALIENVKKAASESVKNYQKELERSRIALSQANHAARADKQRIVMTGLINQGRGLCKKMRDLLQPVPTMKVRINGEEVEMLLC